MLSPAYQTTGERPDCSRREPRTNMFVIASLASPAATNTVKIRNMSASGAMVEGAGLPAIATPCRLSRSGLELEGEIVWLANGRAGIRFDGAALVTQWLPNGGRSQSDVDRAVAEARAGIAAPFSPNTQSLAPAPAPLMSRAVDAAQAAAVADQLENLADDLSGDAHVVMHHMHKLQALDLAIQTLRKLADQR